MSESQNTDGAEKGEHAPPPLSDTLNQPPESSTIQSKQMEVHHHGHVHEKNKWKEYVFQFLMLFLAVFLGFWSENLREKNVEKNLEREYIASLVKDVVSDSLISNGLATDIFTQIKGIDSLQNIFSDQSSWSPKQRDSLIRQCYRLTRYVTTFYPIFFDENTISQLLSSGSMRLIKKDGVAERVMGYHSYIKFVEVQKQLYVTSVNNCIQSLYDIYDVTFLRTVMQDGILRSRVIDSMEGISLLPINAAQLKKFNATLE